MAEILKIKCPVVEGNPHGYYIIDAENRTDDMEVFEEEPIDHKTVAELREMLVDAGMEVPEGAKKADLVALCMSLGG